VTPEQYEAACAALRDRLRKQELARQTRAARRDPVIAALLDDAFARLDLLDPERHLSPPASKGTISTGITGDQGTTLRRRRALGGLRG
jgi:hypothetical protein